jgi:anti-sigma factor RsiW
MSRDCAVLREDLAEHVLGVLPPERHRLVSSHVAGCAGCRKEAGELAEGAAVLALSAPADPPLALEDRVVAALTRGAARERRRGPRVAVLIAAAVAVASAGVVGALAGRVQRLESAAATARERAEAAANRFAEVLEDVGGATPVLSEPLRPIAGAAGGRAILYDAEQGRDFALVVVGGLPSSGEPYLAFLMSPSGRRLELGRLRPSSSGEHSRYRFFGDLSGARDVVVVDASGRTVLRATFSPA